MGFVQEFDRLFAGRRDVWSDGYPDPENAGKYRYATKYSPLTEALLTEHLQGARVVGVYPIQSDNTVTWFAVDFDAPKEANTEGQKIEIDDPFPAALEAARLQAIAFERAGLHVYLERSRSGKGCHVWGFLDRPVQAAVVRQALRPLLTDHTIFESRDRMYPVQDEITERKPLGNLIALPFQGEANKQGFSSFIDRNAEVINPREFLASVRTNSADVVDLLAAKAPKLRPVAAPKPGMPRGATEYADFETGVHGALKALSPYGCSFFRDCFTSRVGLGENQWYAGLQIATHFEHGRDLAHLLSYNDPRYTPEGTDAKYDQALDNPRIGCAWIHENYEHLACKNCPSKNGTLLAPHHTAKRTILQLVGGTRQEMRIAGSFQPDVARAKKLASGVMLQGQRWGIDGLDEFTRLRNGEFIAFGAAPSMGKTWMFVRAALQCARPNKYREPMFVFGFSAETGEQSLRTRMLAAAAEVDARKLTGESPDPLTNAEWKKVEKAAEELERLPIYLDFTSLSADDVLLQVESVLLKHRVPLDTPFVVFFDYLQFGSKMLGDVSEYDRISRLSTEFKFTAKILNRPIIVFSQLRREAEGSDVPDMTWWKNSGRIESDLDLGIIITGERMSSEYATRRLTIVKQREGIANVGLDFTLQQTHGGWHYVGTNDSSPGSAPMAGPLFKGADPLAAE